MFLMVTTVYYTQTCTQLGTQSYKPEADFEPANLETTETGKKKFITCQLMADSSLRITDQNALHSIAFKREKFRPLPAIEPG